MTKEKLLISFSGGETSAYMTQWLLENKQDEYEMKIVFANTGEENEETLRFVDNCTNYFGWDVTWVEAITHAAAGKGCTAKVVDFATASRNGEPFKEMIAKYGLPNLGAPHCSRNLKTYPIKAYLRKIGWKKYYTAIGIRVDEIDRVNDKWKKNRLIYPLAFHDMNPSTKPDVNKWWSNMPFRLELKGYQGNCKVCWKKSLRKLMTIAKENPEHFDNFKEWEREFGEFIPESRKNNPNIKLPMRFFRNNLSVDEIIEMAKQPFRLASDDSKRTANERTSIFSMLEEYDLDTNNGCEESCEPF